MYRKSLVSQYHKEENYNLIAISAIQKVLLSSKQGEHSSKKCEEVAMASSIENKSGNAY